MFSRSHYRLTAKPDLTVSINQIPKWKEHDLVSESICPPANFDENEGEAHFKDPLTDCRCDSIDFRYRSIFPVHDEINSKIFLWQGQPWTLEVDAVVNSTNENLLESASIDGLHAAAGPGLEEECANIVCILGQCRAGEARVSSAYDLPARRVIHTVAPKYNPKFETAAINSLNHCYRAVLELLLENELSSIAVGCIYTERKGFPRELAAHIALRTVRRFLEKHGQKLSAIVFCTLKQEDTEIYSRLLQLYFPRTRAEEEEARGKLPEDTGDENGESSAVERRIRIAGSLANGWEDASSAANGFPVANFSSLSRSAVVGSYDGPLGTPGPQPLDPQFLSLSGDLDQLRLQRWQEADSCQQGWPWSRLIGQEGLGGRAPTPDELDCLHARQLAQASTCQLDDISEMNILYRGGRDSEGRQVLVLVGAHFLPRAMNLDRFSLHAVKEFEAVMKRPFSLVYFHSEVKLPPIPNFGWMRRLLHVLGRPVGQNLQEIYAVHPSLGLRAAAVGLQILVESPVFGRVTYIDRLLDLFRKVPRQSLAIPGFVLQLDAERNPRDSVGVEAHIRRANGHVFHDS